MTNHPDRWQIPRKPVHITADIDNRRALCGEKDPLPVVAPQWAIHHLYLQPRCVACFTAANLASLLTLDDHNRKTAQ